MKNEILKVNNIMYRVKDLRKAEQFYTEVLGLEKAWEAKDGRMIGFGLAADSTEIVLHVDESIENFTYSYLVESVEDFIAARENKGLKVVFGPVDVQKGKYAVLEDPSGNQVPITDLSIPNNPKAYYASNAVM